MYFFSAAVPQQNDNHAFVTWENGFSTEELSSIEKWCDENLTPEKATVGGYSKDDDFSKIRRSDTAWITNQETTRWFWDRMAWIARQLNSQFYRFDLTGFAEDFQYTIYYGDCEGHYDWHLDSGGSEPATRKFSMVLQLSAPEDYEGGDLQILTSTDPENVRKERGLVAAFPSFRLHRVTPVTKGIRKTIVIWISGPPFR